MKFNQSVTYKGFPGTVVGVQPSLFESGHIGYLVAFPWPKPGPKKVDLILHEEKVKEFKNVMKVKSESPVVHRIIDEKELEIIDGTENS